MSNKRSWVNLAVFEQEGEAQELEKYLQEKKFEARTFDDKFMRMLLFLRPPQRVFGVQVREGDYKTVSYLVKQEPDAEKYLKDSLHCPSCGALCIQYPQMTRRFVLPTVLLHAGILLRIIDHEAYCQSCHFIWHLTGHPVPEPQPAAVHPK